jgi:hypothetical protein
MGRVGKIQGMFGDIKNIIVRTLIKRTKIKRTLISTMYMIYYFKHKLLAHITYSAHIFINLRTYLLVFNKNRLFIYFVIYLLIKTHKVVNF